MGIDYYGVLDLPRNATDAEIKKGYRRGAIKFHPLKTNDPKAKEIFYLLGEAYDVLSNFRNKAIYDQFGEEGLKQGVPVTATDDLKSINPYIYHADPDLTFREFFGGDNPFAEYHEEDGIPTFGGIDGRARKRKDNPIELDLMISLEELFLGCMKKMKITRRVLDETGLKTTLKDKILTLNIRPGWPEGSRIIFKEEGDQGPNKIPADIIFTIRDKPHLNFRRQGTDLIYTAKVTLGKALTGCIILIRTLDGRFLKVPIIHVVHPEYRKIVPNEGMPIPGDPTRKGALIIEFAIRFPKHLTKNQKVFVHEAMLDGVKRTAKKPVSSPKKSPSKQKEKKDDAK